MGGGVLESLRYKGPSRNGSKHGATLQVLDQLLLPREKAYMDVRGVEDTWKVIRDMNVRGAPLIAIVGALGLAVELTGPAASGLKTSSDAEAHVRKCAEHLKTSRPTAVNLFTAMDEIVQHAHEVACSKTDVESVISAVVTYAEKLLKEDVETNEAIGKHGAAAILDGKEGHVRVMTHCNTGSLATAGYGTALGVIRSIAAEGRLERVYCTETRPYNQGARLTAFEIVSDGMPGTLITDSMASFLMRTKGLHAVVVGADRVAANGDTANKIGTYQLAVACKHHNVPFYIAAPFTSFDLDLASGDGIVIEERPAKELTHVQGQQIAPEEISVWNPGFDVTPAELISGIITERGVIRPSTRVETDGCVAAFFDVVGFFKADDVRPTVPPTVNGMETSDYRKLEEQTVGAYLRENVPEVWESLGASSDEQLKIREVGDGNLNLVFVVNGPKGSAVVKQALPYVRCVGESWPLSKDRAYFECEALKEEFRHTPNFVPEVFHFHRDLAATTMRYIEPPHIILRKALIAGQRLSTVASDLANFMAENFFYTSGLYLSGPEKREKVAFWSKNHALCELTEAVVFSEPYFDAPHNRWTSPQLDTAVAHLRADVPLKLAVSKLKAKFMDATESLIHGDLHTGSVMVKDGSTVVIDPEFAFYGPIGFDVGAIIGNFFLSYFSQAGHSNGPEYAGWVLDQAVAIWELFAKRFVELWNAPALHKGELFKRAVFPLSEEIAETQKMFMSDLFADSLGFAGAKMIRRIVGVAHVEDLESIKDPDVRAGCERKVLRVARELVVNTRRYTDICDVAAMLREAAEQ